VPEFGPWNDLYEVRQAHRTHWFDQSAINFFNTTFPDGDGTVMGRSPMLYGRYFITGERRELDMPIRYSIRYAHDDARIDTVGMGFRGYDTIEDARRDVLRLFTESMDLRNPQEHLT